MQRLRYLVPMSDLLATLRTALNECPDSQRQIAAATGIHHSLLSRFSRDETGLGLESIEALADYLGFELVLRKTTKRNGRHS